MLFTRLVVVAVLAFFGSAWAQTAENAPPRTEQQTARPLVRDRLIGLAVRLRERDRVIGEVAEVVEHQGRAGLVVQIEAQDHRPVLLDADAVEQEGGKLYLAISETALHDLPTFEGPSGDAGSAKLPYGGTTPGWGSPQGGLPRTTE